MPGTSFYQSFDQSFLEPRRNYLYNANFDIWQRGTSITVANGASSYGPDRWYCKNTLTGGGATVTFAQTTGSSTGAKFGVSLTNGSGATGGTGPELHQDLENFDSLQLYNQTCSFTCQVKAGGNVTQVGLQFMYNTSEAKVTTTIGSEVLVTVNSSTFTTCSINGQALGTSQTTSGIVGIRIRSTAVSSGNIYAQNNAITVEQCSWTLTPVAATAFERQFASIPAEIMACQRYFEKTYDLATAPGTSTTINELFVYTGQPVPPNTGFFSYLYIVPKRTSPTVTFYSVSGTSGIISTGNAAAQNAGAIQFILENTAGTTISAATGVVGHWTADAEI